MKKFREIFLIDDDDIYQFAMKKLFSMTGFCHEFKIFINVHDALDELVERDKNKGLAPELFIVDLNLSIDDGWFFIQSLKELNLCNSSIIYMASSTLDPDDFMKASSNRAIEKLLVKPINENDLLTIKKNHQDLLV